MASASASPSMTSAAKVAHVTNDWLPLPESVVKELGLKEGAAFLVEIVSGEIVLTRLPEEDRVNR